MSRLLFLVGLAALVWLAVGAGGSAEGKPEVVDNHVGFLADDPPVRTDQAAVRAFMLEELERLQKEYVLEFAEEDYGPPAQDGGILIGRQDGRVKIAYVKAVALPAECTLEHLFKYERGAIRRMLADVKRLATR